VTALLISALLLPGVTVEFKLLPPGRDGLVEGVGRARYYQLDEYLKLAELDSELYLLRKDYEAVTKVGEILHEQIETRDQESAACMKELDLMADRSARLLNKWHTCENALQECGSTISPYVMGGAIGAVLTVVGTLLILTSI
jgi:hypothetical protein